MRIDKFFSDTNTLTRSESKKAIKYFRVKVNGTVIKNSSTHVDENSDIIMLDNKQIIYSKYVYIMVNKPQGVVSATDDKQEKTVLDLLPNEINKKDLFPCGRLDKDTVGLVILTNDGVSAHNNLSPKKHVYKKYYFELIENIDHSNVEILEKGTTLIDGFTTLPCKIEMIDDKSGYITLKEGKYHQIKRMFASQGNKVTFLERLNFSDISLDKSLNRGEWRYLTEDEIKIFTQNNK